MTKYGIVKLSRNAAVTSSLNGGRVYLLNIDGFEEVREIRYMTLDEIVDLETHNTVLYFEVVPEEIYQ